MLSIDDEWADLADSIGLTVEGTRELVALMERYGALVRPDGGPYVFSPMVSQGIAAREKKREAAAKGNEKRWGKRDRDESHSESHCE